LGVEKRVEAILLILLKELPTDITSLQIPTRLFRKRLAHP
jgi:hypothetical protein